MPVTVTPEVQDTTMSALVITEVQTRTMPVTIRSATRRSIADARRFSSRVLLRKYGEQFRVIQRNPKKAFPGSLNPMLTFRGSASRLALYKEPNNIYTYQFCHDVKNIGKGASSPAQLHIDVETNNNPSIELIINWGESDLKIPALQPDQEATVCGAMVFEQLLHADLVPLKDQPRFFATITGELNDGKTVLLYPVIYKLSKDGSAKSPESGAFLSFQPVSYPAAYDLQSNVIHACFSINNFGDTGSTSAAVKVSASVNGIATSGSVPIPPLPPGTHMKVVCGDIAVKGLKENKLANLTQAENFQFTGVIGGAVNDGSSIYYRLDYTSVFADIK